MVNIWQRGPWWWSSDQHARILLRRSEFESKSTVLSLSIVWKVRKKHEEAGGILIFIKKCPTGPSQQRHPRYHHAGSFGALALTCHTNVMAPIIVKRNVYLVFLPSQEADHVLKIQLAKFWEIGTYNGRERWIRQGETQPSQETWVGMEQKGSWSNSGVEIKIRDGNTRSLWSLGRINMVQKDSGLNKDGRKRAKFRARGNNGQNKDT